MDSSHAPAADDRRARMLRSAARLRAVLRQGVYFLRSMEGARELTSQQISLLTMLKPGGARMTSIASNLGVRTPTATQSPSPTEPSPTETAWQDKYTDAQLDAMASGMASFISSDG